MLASGMKMSLFSAGGALLLLSLALGLKAAGEPSPAPLVRLENLQQIRGGSCASCPDECKAEWVVVSSIFGGIECQHGPENDKDCGFVGGVPPAGFKLSWCAELNDNNPSPKKEDPDTDGDDLCFCFKCFKQKTATSFPQSNCEAEIKEWQVHCGIVNEKLDGTCNIVDDENNVWIRQYKLAKTPNNDTDDCATGADGAKFKYMCRTPSFKMIYGCVSTNCAVAENAQWVNNAKGKKQKCAAAE